jgi:hypothetical protein
MKRIKLAIALLTATLLMTGCIAPTRTVYVPVEKSNIGTTVIAHYPVYIVRPAPVYWSLNMGWYGGGHYRRGPWRR